MEITEIVTPYERVFDPPARGGGDARGEWASLAFHVDYGDRLFAFIKECGGRVEDNGSGVEVKVPLRFPDTTEVDWYADSYTWEGVGGKGATPRPDPMPDPVPPGVVYAPGPAGTGWDATHVLARVTIQFRKPEFSWAESVLVSRQNRIAARVVTVPGAPYRYAPTASAGVGLPINQDVGIIIPTHEVRLTRHWVPSLEAIEAAVSPLIYHTNNAPLTLGAVTWAPGCVLFAGFDSDQSRSSWNNLTTRIAYSLLCDAAGWDKVMSDITGRFEPVTPIIYPRGPLGLLLTT